jgi:DNA-binding cell septation regulator SpoVG
MNHVVSVVQIRPVKHPKIVAVVDVRIDDMIHKNFKVVRNENGHYWVSNPQIEVGGDYKDTLQFLDVDFEAEAKDIIKAAYLKTLHSGADSPEGHEEEISK